jgi:hypothetical protein
LLSPPTQLTPGSSCQAGAGEPLAVADAVREGVPEPEPEPVRALEAEAVAGGDGGGEAAAAHVSAKARLFVPPQGAPPPKAASVAGTEQAPWPTQAAATTDCEAAALQDVAVKAQPGSEAIEGSPYEAKDTEATTWPGGQAAEAE